MPTHHHKNFANMPLEHLRDEEHKQLHLQQHQLESLQCDSKLKEINLITTHHFEEEKLFQKWVEKHLEQLKQHHQKQESLQHTRQQQQLAFLPMDQVKEKEQLFKQQHEQLIQQQQHVNDQLVTELKQQKLQLKTQHEEEFHRMQMELEDLKTACKTKQQALKHEQYNDLQQLQRYHGMEIDQLQQQIRAQQDYQANEHKLQKEKFKAEQADREDQILMLF